MKIRKGFVSNSSSSSFICDVCGNSESGYDMTLTDAEMYRCVNNHIFCQEHVKPEALEAFNALGKTDEFDSYEVPAALCPCCSFATISNNDIIAFFLKENGMTREALAIILKSRFPNYQDFYDYILPKNKA